MESKQSKMSTNQPIRAGSIKGSVIMKNERITIKQEANIDQTQQSTVVQSKSIIATTKNIPLTSDSKKHLQIQIKAESQPLIQQITTSNNQHGEDKVSSNGREARNRAEKNRRDKLNGSIQELSTMVPHVAESPRRVDKTAVLRFSAHGMRIDYVFGKSSSPKERVSSPLTEAFLRLLNSFLISVTCKGQIVLVSPSIEQHLGHCQADLFGQSLLNLTHPDDHAFLRTQLIPSDLENLFDIQSDDETGKPRPRTQEEEDEIDAKLRADKRNFTVRIARAGQRSDPPIYEAVRVDGCFRRADLAPRGVKSSTFPSGLPLIRRVRGRDDSLPLHTISGNDIVLVAMAQVIKPPSICERLFEATKFEYKTRHLIDGRIVQCDQRISIVAGYMADEVSGLSPFTFMHKDDVRWVMVALRQMYDYGSSYGESCYRLMARTGQFIYLKTRGFLDIDKETNQVRSFVCTNTLISEEEGKKLIREMKKKFAIMIHEGEFAQLECDEPAVENPLQLERAILNLITNLHNTNESDEASVASPNDSYYSDDQHETESHRSTKSPPLALIAPKTDTIKVSIRNSMKIIETAVRGRTPDISSPRPHVPSDENLKRPTVVKKIENFQQPEISEISQRQQSLSPDSLISSSSQSDAKVQMSSSNVIKEEPLDSRVPPLPTSARYFSDSSYPASSPSPENKLFVYAGNDELSTVYQQQCPLGSNYNFKGHSSGYQSSVVSRSTSVLKRTHSEIEGDTAAVKRRLQGDTIPTSSNYMEINTLDPICDPHSELSSSTPPAYSLLNDPLMMKGELFSDQYSYYPESSTQDVLFSDETLDIHHQQQQQQHQLQNEDKLHTIKQEYQMMYVADKSGQKLSPNSSTDDPDNYVDRR